MSSKKWKHAVGDKGGTVTVYEREVSGLLYARAFDPSLRSGKGGYRCLSLGHRDRGRAKAYALDQAAKLQKGRDDITLGRITLAQLLGLYRMHRTPKKSTGEQKADERRAALWTRFLGAGKDVYKITLGEWESFIDARQSGAIDSHGRRVPLGHERPVRVRSVEEDLKWLRWVLNWGTKWRTEGGQYLMRENPVRGFDIPTEKNPRRAIATENRYLATRAKSDQVAMAVRWDGKPKTVRSHLSEILDMLHGTGRRLSAVLQLRYQDLALQEGPHGAIRWPAETDKTGRETLVPIGPDVRAAIDRVLRERPSIGKAYLFPAPGDIAKPVSRDLAAKWLQKAENLAKLDKLDGSLWHAYRRKWATERKHLPDADVAAAGGWANPNTLRLVYQQADQETMLKVVLERGELREA